MFTQKEINLETAESLYWQFKDWLKIVRLTSDEREAIERIVMDLKDLI